VLPGAGQLRDPLASRGEAGVARVWFFGVQLRSPGQRGQVPIKGERAVLLFVQEHQAAESVAVRAAALPRGILRVRLGALSNGCCLGNACSGDLVVYSHSKVILGTIRKTCSAWCSQNVLLIYDENRKEIFSLRMQCCQWANFCPRFLRCSRAV
jgi:hypothetical protein